MYECYIVLCTCVCSHCVYSRTEFTIRIHVWVGQIVRRSAPCSQGLPAWHHARDKMDQALPLLSGESLETMLKTAPKITKFIDEFFLCRMERALGLYITYWYRVIWACSGFGGKKAGCACFGFIYHLLVSSYPSMFWFRRKKRQAVQNVFQPIPGLISCTGAARRWGLLSHAKSVRWLTLSVYWSHMSVMFCTVYHVFIRPYTVHKRSCSHATHANFPHTCTSPTFVCAYKVTLVSLPCCLVCT